MIVYRLCKSRYARDLSGKGAEMVGGRWNSPGFPVIYTSESIALCTAEIAVHLPLGILPEDFKLVHIEIPAGIRIRSVEPAELPVGWKAFPYKKGTCKLGDAFLQAGKFLVMKVPSAVVQGSHNYLINPGHRNFKGVRVVKTEDFEFDRRLFVK